MTDAAASAEPGGIECPPARWEELLDCYYAKRGWDRDGVPTRRLLEELGIPAIP